MRKTKLKPSQSTPTWISKAKDVPATQGMLKLVRSELKAEMKAGFRQVDSKFAQMDSKFEQVLSEVARVGSLVEEQNSRNQIVLEGLTGLFQRQDRLEIQVNESNNLIQNLGARSRR